MITKEDFHSFGLAPVIYRGRMKGNLSFPIDARRFIFYPDEYLMLAAARIEGQSDTEKVYHVENFIKNTIRHISDESTHWKFPTETLISREARCIDVAILIVTLLLHLSIPGELLRVATGMVEQGGKSWSHAWGLYRYQNRWVPMDPFTPFNHRDMKDRLSIWENRFYQEIFFMFNHLHSWKKPEALSSKS